MRPTEIAKLLSRRPGELKRLDDPRRAFPRLALLCALAGALGAHFLPSFLSSVGFGKSFGPDLLIPKREQRVLHTPSLETCDPGASTLDPSCPAHPGFAALHGSGWTRADADHAKRLLEAGPGELWIGMRIGLETLRRAAERGASHFVLGYLEAEYEIWVDGRRLYFGDGWHESELMSFPVPPERARSGKPLVVAIRMKRVERTKDPDMLNMFGGGEGFYTPSRYDLYASRATLQWKGRPFAFAITYLMLSFTFFAFWSPARVKQEYFFLSLHTLVAAIAQFRMSQMVWAQLAPDFGTGLRVVLDWLVAASGMMLGFSFARLRRSILVVSTAVSLVVPIALILLSRDPLGKILASEFMRYYAAPLGYGLGAIACLVQLAVVLRSKRSSARIRARALVLFSMSMLSVAAYYGFVLPAVWATPSRAWFGVEHLSLVIILGAIALREVRVQATLVSRTPASEYHRRAVLPERVHGALLALNLVPHEDRSVGQLWRTHVATIVARAGGILVHRQGDEAIAFFDSDRDPRPLRSAILASHELERAAAAISRTLGLSGARVDFRAALVTGAIRPIWETVGGHREPYWTEAGDTAAFVQASRLGAFAGAFHPSSSVVVMEEATAARLLEEDPSAAAYFRLRGRKEWDKHGSEYLVAYYSPEAAREQVLPESAESGLVPGNAA